MSNDEFEAVIESNGSRTYVSTHGTDIFVSDGMTYEPAIVNVNDVDALIDALRRAKEHVLRSSLTLD